MHKTIEALLLIYCGGCSDNVVADDVDDSAILMLSCGVQCCLCCCLCCWMLLHLFVMLLMLPEEISGYQETASFTGPLIKEAVYNIPNNSCYGNQLKQIENYLHDLGPTLFCTFCIPTIFHFPSSSKIAMYMNTTSYVFV